jgi:uncharacterized membrane protein
MPSMTLELQDYCVETEKQNFYDQIVSTYPVNNSGLFSLTSFSWNDKVCANAMLATRIIHERVRQSM